MPVEITRTRIGKVLTRSSGYLRGVCSHSLQPYRGCSYGSSLCGVGCYVRHSPWVTRGRTWGGFLEVRINAAESYLEHAGREGRWARRERGRFVIFLSSSTDPFVPQEREEGVTRALLEAMLESPPDDLIVQTHSHRVLDALEPLVALAGRCRLRVQLSIESDRDRLPGLPAPASPVERRLAAAGRCREAGLRTVITVAPLLPIAEPELFFQRIAACADGVVLDHFVGGDGSADGGRTRRTGLPAAMAALEPASVDLGYRDAMEAHARRVMPGRVGVGPSGFAGELT
jgi:DNA repair photolyase